MMTYIRAIHPFPARMAPDTLAEWIQSLDPNSIVLDPMCGSGVAVRQSLLAGHRGVGVDIDPLAVLMSSVWTKRVALKNVLEQAQEVCDQAQSLKSRDVVLPWIDRCKETTSFTKYWFAIPQRKVLRRIAFVLLNAKEFRSRRINNLLWLALSRTIVTKQAGASLAWDVSHSRPHKVRVQNSFDVYRGFLYAANSIAKTLAIEKLPRDGRVYPGDSRILSNFPDHLFDAILSSPPYLNAIDYLRGHKFALVWMGYSIPQLRALRAISIGAERAPDNDLAHDTDSWNTVSREVPSIQALAPRQQKIICRYIYDSAQMLSGFKRVLKPHGLMVLVLGDSLVRGKYVENSKIYACVAKRFGFEMEDEKRRPIEPRKRYLPVVSRNNSLEKRMRYETVQAYRLSA